MIGLALCSNFINCVWFLSVTDEDKMIIVLVLVAKSPAAENPQKMQGSESPESGATRLGIR
jgi:hypothetical protein